MKAVRLRDLLAGACGHDEIVDSPEALRLAGCDTFHVGAPPLAVLEPASIEALAAALPRLVGAGLAVAPRGAALSYSAGHLPDGRDWVAVDLRRLARVIDVNEADGHVRVEAGCTWATLDAALAPRHLRTPVRGPASGRHATIGGSLSNDAIFHGSARYGTVGDGVLGLLVVLADGRVLRTGARVLGGGDVRPAYGPDLTRAFVGACGAFGIVVEASLRVVPRVAAVRLAGYRCATREIALGALRDLNRHGDATEALLLDPSIATLLDGRAADDASVPGRAFARGAPYLLSIAVDAPTGIEAELRQSRADAACRAAGAERDGEGLLGPWLESPFPPPQMLRGADGRRWVPVHGLVPHSRVAAALDALDDCMRAHVREVEALDVRWTATCASVGPHGVLVEANLTWPGEPNPVVDHYLGPDPAAGPHDPGKQAGIARLRVALAAALDGIGASHLQIGRFYAYRDRIDPVAADVLAGFKRLCDPPGAMNPGVLGLDAARAREVRP